MFNFMTICESVRRHWVAIALIGILGLALGLGTSFIKNEEEGEVKSGPLYTAEAVLYATGYGYDNENRLEGGEYNYSYSEAYMMTDIRRLVVSGDVAGKVREEFGKDVVITSPYWFDRETEYQNYDRFIYVDASAPDADTAIAAANRAMELTKEKAQELVPVDDIKVSEEAVLKSGDSKKAADWGADKLVEDGKVEPKGPEIGVKNIVIFLFAGVFLSLLAFVSYDILSRKIRSARDVERLMEVPVLADFSDETDKRAFSDNLSVLAKRNNLSSLCLASLCKEDDLDGVARSIDRTRIPVKSEIVFSEASDAASQLCNVDGVVLVVKEAAANGKQIDHALKSLSVAGAPVVGAVFVPRAKKRK